MGRPHGWCVPSSLFDKVMRVGVSKLVERKTSFALQSPLSIPLRHPLLELIMSKDKDYILEGEMVMGDGERISDNWKEGRCLKLHCPSCSSQADWDLEMVGMELPVRGREFHSVSYHGAENEIGVVENFVKGKFEANRRLGKDRDNELKRKNHEIVEEEEDQSLVPTHSQMKIQRTNSAPSIASTLESHISVEFLVEKWKSYEELRKKRSVKSFTPQSDQSLLPSDQNQIDLQIKDTVLENQPPQTTVTSTVIKLTGGDDNQISNQSLNRPISSSDMFSQFMEKVEIPTQMSHNTTSRNKDDQKCLFDENKSGGKTGIFDTEAYLESYSSPSLSSRIGGTARKLPAYRTLGERFGTIILFNQYGLLF